MSNNDNNTPVYLQIAEKIATQIFSGKLEPGMQLPTVREIALAEWANPNTAQKALAELERDGLILSRSTSGKFVTGDTELIMQKRDQYAAELTKTYEQKMRDIGAEVTIPKILWPADYKPHHEEKLNKNFNILPDQQKRERKKWFF
ncbi:GntR family transcriptional regulator [Candidatus Saccharibacteria bacterium]|nr:GntR family transcriptional regulator [Candidatus Saccharibacteria bacterium]